MPDNREVHIDIETFSEVDIKKVGTYVYANDPSTEMLLASWKYAGPNEPTHTWDATETAIPPELRNILDDPDITLLAFNAPFERLLINTLLKLSIPASRYICTMVEAFGMSFAGGLGEIGAQVGISQDKAKLKDGKALVHHFCKPQAASRKVRRWTKENDPIGWARFKLYCENDVSASEEIHNFVKMRITADWDRRYWLSDQAMNDRGLPVDIDLVNMAVKISDNEKAQLRKQLIEKTGLANPTSTAQMKGFLQEYFKIEGKGTTVDNMQAGTVKDMLSDAYRNMKGLPLLDSYVKEILRDYQYASKSSTAKLEKFISTSFYDGNGNLPRVKCTVQYAGASRTNRNAGRLIQIHNFPRPTVDTPGTKEFDMDVLCRTIEIDGGNNDIFPSLYESPMGAISSALRGMFKAPDGKKLVVCDLAGIEGRVLPWLCFYEQKLKQIADGMDMYKVDADDVFKVGYDNITKDQRQIGKVITLSCGFGGSFMAFQKMAVNYNVHLSDKVVKNFVYKWRERNAPIVDLWRDIDTAVFRALKNPGDAFKAGRMTFIYARQFLCCRIPSGRILYFHKPQLDGTNLTYMGMGQYSHKWERQHSYGGKLAQACLAKGTEVRTSRGWIPIEKVSSKHKVWDGLEWVTQGGVVNKGLKNTINVWGLNLTPDHGLLTTKGWVRADVIGEEHVREWTGVKPIPRTPLPLSDLGLSKVYDLLNCGPRSRFTVRGADGTPCIVHNCTQSTARDILAQWTLECEANGLLSIGNVHDEIICEQPEATAYADLQTMIDIIREHRGLPWCEGLPLDAAGYVSDRYKKD